MTTATPRNLNKDERLRLCELIRAVQIEETRLIEAMSALASSIGAPVTRDTPSDQLVAEAMKVLGEATYEEFKSPPVSDW